MKDKICIITGANSGIGKQAAIQIATKGYHVIIACRNQQRGEIALEEIRAQSQSTQVKLGIVDMSSKASICSFADSLHQKFDHIDVLIHNAALFNVTQKEAQYTNEGFETVWMTNHIGPVYLTEKVMDLLKNSDDARVLTISSKGLLAKPFLKVNLADPEYKSRKFDVTNAYYQSKLAQMIYTWWLAKELENTSITVNAIRVPAVQIDISRHPDLSPFMKWAYQQKSKQSITPQRMAETYAYLATDAGMKSISGKYFDENNQEISADNYTINLDNINKVIELTNKYL
jgi:NAD(P)-dependent dehydrogenase (short-subunit alcohol dehydrogenase family)